jgi:hypothetical protein
MASARFAPQCFRNSFGCSRLRAQVNACSLPIIREIEKQAAAYHSKLGALSVQTQSLFVDLSMVSPTLSFLPTSSRR